MNSLILTETMESTRQISWMADTVERNTNQNQTMM